MPGSRIAVSRLAANLIWPGADLCKCRVADQLVNGGFCLSRQMTRCDLTNRTVAGHAPGKQGRGQGKCEKTGNDFAHMIVWLRKIGLAG